MQSTHNRIAQDLHRVWCESLGVDGDKIWRWLTDAQRQPWLHLASYVYSMIFQAEIEARPVVVPDQKKVAAGFSIIKRVGFSELRQAYGWTG